MLKSLANLQTNSEPPLQTDLITPGTNKAICNYAFFGLIRQSKMTVLPGALYRCRAHPSDFEITCYLFVPGKLSRVFSGLLAFVKQKDGLFARPDLIFDLRYFTSVNVPSFPVHTSRYSSNV